MDTYQIVYENGAITNNEPKHNLKIEYSLEYISNDGLYREFNGYKSFSEILKDITFLEERGCHKITVYAFV